jgi:hypothetical protein
MINGLPNTLFVDLMSHYPFLDHPAGDFSGVNAQDADAPFEQFMCLVQTIPGERFGCSV